MSNIHALSITGSVPYDWASKLTPDEAQIIAAYFLGPSIGVKLKFGKRWYGPRNEHNGQTAMYEFTIDGEEALRTEAIIAITNVFRRVGIVTTAVSRDVENSYPLFRDIPAVPPLSVFRKMMVNRIPRS